MISTSILGWEKCIEQKYNLKQVLGQGSFGKVVLGYDKSITSIDLKVNQNSLVAIKGLSDVFDHVNDAKTAYREMHILKRLKHNNIVLLKEIIVPRLNSISVDDLRLHCFHDLNQGKVDFLKSLGHLYLVFEFVETDLRKIIESDQFMTKDHIRYILYQILCALKYVHSANVIHRDLKPANILINCKDCGIKIADFGLSRVVDSKVIEGKSVTDHPLELPTDALMHRSASDADENPVVDNKESVFIKPSFTRTMTSHVVTRWYRSPEVILKLNYTSAIDIWSVGCIFAELLGMIKENCPKKEDRHPLFPGRSCPSLSPIRRPLQNISATADQLTTIFKVLGSPTDDDLVGLQQETINHIKKMPQYQARNPKSIFPSLDDDEQDLLLSMLKFNSNQRVTVDQALSHKYFAKIRKIEIESICESPMNIDVEQIEEDREHLYDSLIKEIIN